MTEKILVLSFDDLLNLTSYAHWIPILNGLHRDFMTKSYPGWAWNQIIPVLVRTKILVKNSKDPRHRALNQGLFIDPDITGISISVQDRFNELEFRITKITALKESNVSKKNFLAHLSRNCFTSQAPN